MTFTETSIEIRKELSKAMDKHPHWLKDVIHQVAIMNEESGESIRAALNHEYEGENILTVKKELIQTAAMCYRCLMNL